jgi:hypothetical protein
VSQGSNNDAKERERRRFPRTPVYGEIVGQIYTETAAPVLDLSEGGALLEVPCVLRPRSFYTLRLALGSGAVMLLKASVVRSYVHHLEKHGEGETRVRYHAALQFVDPSQRDRELLRLRIAGDESLAGDLGAQLEPERLEAPSQPAAAAATDPLLVAAWPQRVPSGPERRDSERLHVDGRLEGEVGLRLESHVLMLSLGGMTVRMPFAPQLGSVVSCALEIDGAPVRVQAIVRDAYEQGADGDSPRHIVGLEFLGLSGPARAQIEGHVARRLKAADGRG